VNSISSGEFIVNGGYNGNSNANLLAQLRPWQSRARRRDADRDRQQERQSLVTSTNQATASAISPASQNLNATATAVAMLEVPAIEITKLVTALVPNGHKFHCVDAH